MGRKSEVVPFLVSVCFVCVLRRVTPTKSNRHVVSCVLQLFQCLGLMQHFVSSLFSLAIVSSRSGFAFCARSFVWSGGQSLIPWARGLLPCCVPLCP